MTRSFIAVASAEHVRRGRAGGFMQVNHGKAAPLRRLQVGDRVVYYSPTATFRGTDRLQAFTAIGTVRGAPYQVDMGGGFRPFRRDVDWDAAEEVPIKPILDRLAFAAGKPSWGYQLRFGLLEISEQDMQTISQAMRTHPQASYTVAMQSISTSNGPCQAETQMKLRAGGSVGK
jgi:hypothetical protein